MFHDIKEFLSSILSKARKNGIFKRFGWIIIAALLTAIIPLTIAICYFQFVYTNPNDQSPIITVELLAPDGTAIESAESHEDNLENFPLAEILYDLSTSKVSATKPKNFSKTQNLVFSISVDSIKTTYKCYFTESSESSYLEDESGAFFMPDSSVYSRFLTSKYSEAVYPEAMPPSLLTSETDTIIPASADWNYSLNNGSVAKSKSFKSTEEILTYYITGAIAFDFSRKPSKCNFEVKRSNGNIIFSGSPEKLHTLTANDGEELWITAEAEWEKDNNYSSYGKQTYEFKIICTEPSSFILNTTTVSGGDFVFMTVTDVYSLESIIYNINDTSALKRSNFDKESREAIEALYNYKPQFFMDGKNAYAFLPIPRNIPNTEFRFSLSCGISKEDFLLSITPALPSRVTLPNEDQSLDIAMTDEQKSEFSSILRSLEKKGEPAVCFREGFISPTQYGFEKSIDFNSNIVQSNSSLLFLANSYTTTEIGGASVKSGTVGRVFASGYSSLLGNYVIIDHGIGLCTWYCGLSDISVEIGDVVKKGDAIGKSGSSSALCNNGVNILCSINGYLIDPDRVFDQILIK